MSPSTEPGLLPDAHYVLGRSLRVAVETAVQQGIPKARVLEGLSYGIQTAEDRLIVPWADYCVVIERVEELIGGPEALEEMLAQTYHQALPEVRVLAGAMMGPKRFARFLASVATPALFPALQIGVEDLGALQLRIRFELRPRARPCLTFFRGTIGTMRGCTCHLGLPEAGIVATITPTSGVYEMTLPASPSRRDAWKNATEAILGRAGEWIADAFADAGESSFPGSASVDPDEPASQEERRLREATQTWSLTTRQTEVLKHLVHGRANKEIARDLGCAENTVELHVTNLLRKAGLASRGELISYFWSSLGSASH